MVYRKHLLSFLILALFACGEKTNDYPVLSINPESLIIQASRGEFITFHVITESDYKLQRFVVSEKLKGSNERNIYDTILLGFNAAFYFDYFTPLHYSDQDIILTFRSLNEEGYETRKSRKILISDTLFTEAAGQHIYSAKGAGECAFNLLETEAISCTLYDSIMDIVDIEVDTLSNDLDLIWGSPSGCEFVRFNEFDYGNATLQGTRDGFEAGNKITEVSDLDRDDILLVKVNRSSPSRYFVLKITGIIDEEGVDDDYYEFNLKY